MGGLRVVNFRQDPYGMPGPSVDGIISRFDETPPAVQSASFFAKWR